MSDGLRAVEMANLVCRFGPHVLLDYFDEIVYPSFVGTDLKRKYDKTKYFFEDVRLVHLEGGERSPVIGIAGRFIKDTSLTREQVYVEGQGLVKDHDSIQSSPSALFLLVLNSHRLVYVKETSFAPSKDAFRSTLLSFLKKTHAEFVKEKLDEVDEIEDLGRDEKKQRKDEIRDSHPRPTLQLIALTSQDSIEDFIRKYDVLQQMRITLADRNDEFDLNGFFEQVQKSKDSIGSTSTTIVHKSKEGLDKEEAVSQVAAATAQGNQAVVLTGTDEGGDKLVGNNEKFQLKKSIDEIDDNPEIAAGQMYEVFSDLVKSGVVVLDGARSATLRKISQIFASYFE